MSLATDLLRARNKRLRDELTEKMGDKEGARVFEAITETPLVLLDTATILAGWDNCKTVYENMANILGDICEHKRQIVRNFGEKTWQETFENFQKTNDLKVFENAVKSQIPTQNFNKNINLQISNENANLKNSENNITNPQKNGNDFKM